MLNLDMNFDPKLTSENKSKRVIGPREKTLEKCQQVDAKVSKGDSYKSNKII
jgi:hypothetical protein